MVVFFKVLFVQFNLSDYLGHTTFVTGPEKHCGKTTFMNRVFGLCSRAVSEGTHPGKPPAVLTVGYDGEARDYLSGARKPSVPVRTGDIFVTAERFLRSSGALPEILETVPGSTALGRIAVARAGRCGSVALVGPEGNSAVSWILGFLSMENLADTVLIDGAINRITQVSGIPGSSFVYVLRIDRVNQGKSMERMQRIAALAGLPVYGGHGDGKKSGSVAFVEGALTAQTLAAVPPSADAIVIDDFTKVFLEAGELNALLRSKRVLVRTPIDFRGFAISCRGLDDGEFLRMLPGETMAGKTIQNLYRDIGALA